MYISKFNSKFIESGLIFDICDSEDNKFGQRDKRRSCVRHHVNHFKDGMDIYIQKNGVDLSTSELLNEKSHLILVSEVYHDKGDTPLSKFLLGIPDCILNIAREYLYLQYFLLHAAANCKAAYDLLLINPNLLWMKIYSELNHYNQWIKYSADEDLSQSQVQILNQIIIRKAVKSDVSLLKKIMLYQGDSKELMIVKNFVQSTTIRPKRLHHLRRVPVILLPELYHHNFTINQVFINVVNKNLNSGVNLNPIFENFLETRRHILSMQDFYSIKKIDVLLDKVKSGSELEKLHRKVLNEYGNGLHKVYFQNPESKEEAMKEVFCDSPISDSPGEIELLANRYQLIQESIIMGHCVASLDPDKNNHFYRVLTKTKKMKTRSTLHIRWNTKERCFKIHEIKGKNNSKVDMVTIDQVSGWLNS